jgi:hypothetical protein
MNTPDVDAGRLERRVRLLPCPFCGGTATEEATGLIELKYNPYQLCWIECGGCHAKGPELSLIDGEDYQCVRDVWNLRA